MSTTDYSKLKNAELETLLKDRGLPHAGKKAEMVARLTEDDQTKASSATAAPASSTDTATTQSATAGGASTRAPNPVAVPNQVPAVDPATTSDLHSVKDTTAAPVATTAADSAAPAGEKKDDAAAPKDSFASNLNLAPTDIDAEIAKRKARAAKFGVADSDSEAIKALERAKRFGTGAAGDKDAAAANGGAEAGGSMGMSRLDEALPERGERKRARGAAAEGDSWEDEGLKRRRGGGGAGGFRGRGRGGGGDRREGSRGEKRGGTANWMSDADKAAAEKRKAKFASSSAA